MTTQTQTRQVVRAYHDAWTDEGIMRTALRIVLFHREHGWIVVEI